MLKKSLFFIVMMVVCLPGLGQATLPDSEMVSFRWENWEPMDREFLETQRTKLVSQGARVEEVKKTVPNLKNPAVVWLVMAGVATVTILAETIVNAVKEMKQCGIVVDATGAETKIRRSCDLDGGEVLAVHHDGTIDKIEFEDTSSLDPVALIQAVLTKGK